MAHQHDLKHAVAVSVGCHFSGSSTCQPRILASAIFGSGYSAIAFIPWHQSIPDKLQQQLSSTLHSLPFQHSFSTLHFGLLLFMSALHFYTDTCPMVLCPSQHNHRVLYTARWKQFLLLQHKLAASKCWYMGSCMNKLPTHKVLWTPLGAVLHILLNEVCL